MVRARRAAPSSGRPLALHALEQVAVRHALDARQCFLREAGGFRGAIPLQEPLDAGQEMPEPVVRVAAFERSRQAEQFLSEGLSLFR
jgi:hypothetical protein